MLLRKILTSSAGVLLCLTGGAAAAGTLFEQDATTSIDKGIEWLATAGAYNNPSSAGQAAGLTLLALLEKRPGTDLDAAPQGYSGANDTDKGRMRKTVAYLISQVNSVPFDLSYRDGQNLMALSLYLRTGGLDRGEHPDLPVALPYTVLGALNTMFDRIKSYQRASGYWCYGPSFQGCDDSSTTQFVMAGLAGLRAVYSDTGKPWADAARLTQLNDMAAKARQGYVTNGAVNLASSTCGNLGGDERAHGYNVGSRPSLQQTGSGVWIQLAGGADVNDASVQGYLKWIRNRYRYSDISGQVSDFWPSYWYYMWSTSKALLFIRNSGVAAAPGNLTGNSMGILPAADAPACNARQLHRDPATDSRIALFGAGGAGYYLGQPKDFYYDFAYEVMRRQQASGQYTDAFGSSSWNVYSRQAYALLILQRSVGGGCIDSDKDGICDSDEGGDETAQALYCDADFDGKVTYSDTTALGKLLNGKYTMAIPLTPQNQWANYANGGSSANVIDANDYWQCVFVRAGSRPLKYYETTPD